MSAEWRKVDEAEPMMGLRLVLTQGVPNPWAEAAKAVFEVKRIPYTRVIQRVPSLPARRSPHRGGSLLGDVHGVATAPPGGAVRHAPAVARALHPRRRRPAAPRPADPLRTPRSHLPRLPHPPRPTLKDKEEQMNRDRFGDASRYQPASLAHLKAISVHLRSSSSWQPHYVMYGSPCRAYCSA